MTIEEFLKRFDRIMVDWDHHEVLESKDAMEAMLDLRLEVSDPPYVVPMDENYEPAHIRGENWSFE